MKKLKALHDSFCEDMTYQEYWEQLKSNGQYSALKGLIKELKLCALLRVYKFEQSPVVQGYIEDELNSRQLKKFRG